MKQFKKNKQILPFTNSGSLTKGMIGSGMTIEGILQLKMLFIGK